MEIMIVIFGSLYFFIMIIRDEIKRSDFNSRSSRMRLWAAEITDPKLEKNIEDFIMENYHSPRSRSVLFASIDDNLRAIFGDNYSREVQLLTFGGAGFDREKVSLISPCRREYFRTGFLYPKNDYQLIKALMMSKHGRIPQKQYYDGFDAVSCKEVAFVKQIQKNLDQAGMGKFRLMFYEQPHSICERKTVWKHGVYYKPYAKPVRY